MNTENMRTCYHSEYSIDKVKQYVFTYLKQLIVDNSNDYEDFPDFIPGSCTTECKEKMRVIVKYTLTTQQKLILNYYDDCKMVFDNRANIGCSVMDYYFCLRDNKLTKEAQLYMNIGIVNGVVVRLCDGSNDFLESKIDDDITKLIEEEQNK